jgi:nucleotide-binding universal stress UspA family protein
VSNPPADVAILRSRPYEKLSRIVVPVAGGPNTHLAVITAVALARNSEEESEVVLVHVVIGDISAADAEARANHAFRRATQGVDYPVTTEMIQASDPLEGILKAAETADMVVIGATKEPRLKNLLLGNVASRVVEQANCPVLIVKRRSTMLDSVLRETVLTPVRKSEKLEKMENGGK